MTGEQLQAILKYHGVKKSELAAKLGINYTSLRSRLQVKTIKPNFLKEIETITGLDLSSYDDKQVKEPVSVSEILLTQMKMQELLIKNLEEQQEFFRNETTQILKENKKLQEKINIFSSKENVAESLN